MCAIQNCLHKAAVRCLTIFMTERCATADAVNILRRHALTTGRTTVPETSAAMAAISARFRRPAAAACTLCAQQTARRKEERNSSQIADKTEQRPKRAAHFSTIRQLVQPERHKQPIARRYSDQHQSAHEKRRTRAQADCAERAAAVIRSSIPRHPRACPNAIPAAPAPERAASTLRQAAAKAEKLPALHKPPDNSRCQCVIFSNAPKVQRHDFL